MVSFIDYNSVNSFNLQDLSTHLLSVLFLIYEIHFKTIILVNK